VVDKLFVLFATQRHYVTREGEFHADGVGASIAGSNAMIITRPTTIAKSM